MDIAKYTFAPQCHRGHFGGFYGVPNLSLEKLPNGWTDWHQIRYTSADSSGKGHRLNIIRLTITHGGILGVLGGQQFKSLGNVVKRLDQFEINFAHIMQVNLVMDTVWTNWPHETPGGAGLSKGNVLGFKGVNISSKVWGMPRSPEKTN